MELRRTVLVKLEVVDAHAALLLESIEQFLWAANHVVDHARQDNGYVLTTSHLIIGARETRQLPRRCLPFEKLTVVRMTV